MNPIETKIKEKLNLVPEVAVEIAAALEAAKICGDEKLDVILPALGDAIQTTKTTDGKYKVSLVSADGVLRVSPTNEDKPLSIKEWISDFAFEPSLPAGAEGFISYADSLHCTAEQLQKIADGKLIVGKPVEVPAADGSVPSSQLIDKTHRGQVKIKDIASGKTKVDMSK